MRNVYVFKLDCMNSNAIGGKPLFPQWSNHVYPQFLPSSHPHSCHNMYSVTSTLSSQPVNHRIATRHYSAPINHTGQKIPIVGCSPYAVQSSAPAFVVLKKFSNANAYCFYDFLFRSNYSWFFDLCTNIYNFLRRCFIIISSFFYLFYFFMVYAEMMYLINSATYLYYLLHEYKLHL